jgi:hypothetical protein
VTRAAVSGEGAVASTSISTPTEPVKFSASRICGGGALLRVMLRVFAFCAFGWAEAATDKQSNKAVMPNHT